MPASLATLVNRQPHTGATPWVRYDAAPTDVLVDFVAEHLATYVMRGAPQLEAAWRRVIAGGGPYSTREADAIREFFVPLFGTRLKPLSDGHAESVIAEHIWYVLALNDPGAKPLARIEGPKSHVTAPGPDGLSAYLEGGTYSFRVWEVKKHLGNSHSRVLGDAYKQLKDSAPQYLAQYTVIGQELSDRPLAAFYARLVEMWLGGESAAGAGVSVVGSHGQKRCFLRMHDHLSHLQAGTCFGVLAVIQDYRAFALRVREVVWKGL